MRVTQAKQQDPRVIPSPRLKRKNAEDGGQVAMEPRELPRGISSRTERVCFVAAAVYAGVCLLLLIWSLITGDRLGVFLGLLTLGVVFAAALVGRAMIRLDAGLSAVTEGLQDIQDRLVRLEQANAARLGETSEAQIAALNLAAIGHGDPSAVVAATLDRSVFPRFVATMDREPPAESGGPREAENASPDATGDPTAEAGVTARNLLRAWRIAVRDGDLATCRQVHATLVDTADPATVALLTAQLKQLSGRTEKALRQAFSKRIRERDYSGAIEVGERIRSLWPNESVARDFERIKPYLLRRDA